MGKIIEILFEKILTTLLKIVGLVLTLAIVVQIFSRFIMVNPFSWTEELSRFSFIWFCFLGSSYALKKKLHLGIDYFYHKLNTEGKRRLDIVINGLVLVFGLILFFFGFRMMGITSIQRSPILRINMAFMYAVLPVTGFFFTLFSANQLKSLFKKNCGENS